MDDDARALTLRWQRWAWDLEDAKVDPNVDEASKWEAKQARSLLVRWTRAVRGRLWTLARRFHLSFSALLQPQAARMGFEGVLRLEVLQHEWQDHQASQDLVTGDMTALAVQWAAQRWR